MLMVDYYQTDANEIRYSSGGNDSRIVAVWRRKLDGNSKVFSRREAARHLDVDVRTLTRWKNDELLKPMMVHGRCLYTRKDLSNFQQLYVQKWHYKQLGCDGVDSNIQ